MAGENSLNGRFIESWSVASYPWIATEGRGGRCIVADDVPFRESFPRRTEVKDIGDIVPGLESLVTLREKRATFKEAILLAGNTVENRVSRVDYDSNKNSTTLLSLFPRYFSPTTFLQRQTFLNYFLLSLQPRNLLGNPPPPPFNPFLHENKQQRIKGDNAMQRGEEKKTFRKRERKKGKKKKVSSFDLKPTESSSHKEIRYIVLEERRNDEGQRPISNYIPLPPLARR